jgi:hypothetical protein
LKSRIVVVLLFAALVGLIWSKRFGMTNDERPPASVSDQSAEAATEDAAVTEAALPEEPVEPAAPPLQPVDPRGFVAETEPAARLPLKEKIPSGDTMREQVSKNPHGTPTALTGFSIALGEKMEAAQKSEPEAKALFQELQDCTLGTEQQGRHSIQALCLLNAKRLGQSFPALARDYEDLERRSDPRTVDLIHGMSL